MTDQGINLLNYATGAVAFFIFFCQLSSRRYRRLYPIWLPVAALATSLKLAVIIANAALTLPPLTLFASDLLFYSAWYAALLSMLCRLTGARPPPWMTGLAIALIGSCSIAAVLAFRNERPITQFYASNLVIWGNLLMAVCGLVLVEQLYRNMSAITRHAVKFFCLGLASLLIYELYLFAQILVFQSIPAAGWNARGAIYGVSGLFLIITLSKTEDVPRVALSRNLVFYTTSLLGAGALLFLMSAVGYYVKIYGQSWGAALQQVITFTAILAVVLTSSVPRWRASALVFIDKHFFSHRYDYRAEWLKLIHTLSRPVDEGDLYQHAIKALVDIFNSPGGVLWLNQHSRFEPVATYRMAMPVNAVESEGSTFIAIMKSKEWIFDAHEKYYPEDQALPEWAADIDGLWIVVPLLNEQHLLGFMGLLQSDAVSTLNWEDLDLLKTVGRQLASYIARHQAAELLAQSRQFDAYNKLTAFIMHDLKNLIAQQALVVENAAKHKENPAFIDDMVGTIENSVQRMNSLLNKMQRRGPTPGKILVLDSVLVDAIKKCSTSKPIPSLRLEARGMTVRADRESLIMILIHLIKNAQEATRDQGYVDVRLTKGTDRAIIQVEDNGAGMSESFLRSRLFKPFVTTKSDKGMGIGVYQAQEYVHQIGGEISVESKPDTGTTFCISIPFCSAEKAVA